MSDAVKERPILFRPEMVRAILAGRKSQTRRVVKPQPIKIYRNWEWVTRKAVWHWPGGFECCPYGLVGERLWVREAWRTGIEDDDQKPRDLSPHEQIRYEVDSATYEAGQPVKLSQSLEHGWGKYRHARFMPRWASRISLEVTGVRVERVQDITEADAKSEGFRGRPVRSGFAQAPATVFGVGDDNDHAPNARCAFRDLWHEINGEESWASNPWVWVVSFKRVQG